jgi:hypothetical protein
MKICFKKQNFSLFSIILLNNKGSYFKTEEGGNFSKQSSRELFLKLPPHFEKLCGFFSLSRIIEGAIYIITI